MTFAAQVFQFMVQFNAFLLCLKNESYNYRESLLNFYALCDFLLNNDFPEEHIESFILSFQILTGICNGLQQAREIQFMTLQQLRDT